MESSCDMVDKTLLEKEALSIIEQISFEKQVNLLS
jgi:hypothetical protein